MDKTYAEGMPLTSIECVGESLLVAGGGGNPLFGFPNRLVLLSPSKKVLSQVDVKGVVVSVKMFGTDGVVEHEDDFYFISVEDNTISTPIFIGEKESSPIIVDGRVAYIKNNKIYSLSVEDLKKKAKKEKEIKKKIENNIEKEVEEVPILVDGLKEEDEIISLFANNNRVFCTVKKNKSLFLVREGTLRLLDGNICSYTREKALGYIVQLKNEKSLISVEDKEGKIFNVLEMRCTSIHCLAKGAFLVGTGDGLVIKYAGGREVWRKKVAASPISSISDIKGNIFCTTINGRVIPVILPSTLKIAKFAFIIGSFICAGVTARYFTKKLIQQ